LLVTRRQRCPIRVCSAGFFVERPSCSPDGMLALVFLNGSKLDADTALADTQAGELR